jgi:hypothetical protein
MAIFVFQHAWIHRSLLNSIPSVCGLPLC